MSRRNPDGPLESRAPFDRAATPLAVRNHVLVLPSVICSHAVADRIAEAVEGCVATPHDHGCAQIGRDNDRTERTLVAMGAHPNVAGCVVVGLGCEHVQSSAVAAALEGTVPVRELSIQGVGGTDACLERGREYAAELRAAADGREPAAEPSLGELTVGVVSTDLTEATLETAEPLVGAFVERVLDAGGRVVLAGTERLAAHPESAREWTASADGGSLDLETVLERERSGPPRAPRIRHRADGLTPDGLATLWGSAPIDELLEYGTQPAPASRLAFVDTASRFEEATTGLVAAGCHLVVHVTGDGIPTGHPLAPVVKVCATPETLAAVSDDIDVDARTATADDLTARVLAVASGTPSRAEVHGVTSFAIERAGPSL
ncbi:UxaA family hydrolase [Natronobiforma cellulositropha]|uniref:UxaA family hydrolase n=1 Tax=Natronobiforma cellulositropha TaxID=1679076 RepID=UPI0021D56D3C|nr:UxaA family hydrolase [Natronobiforma cellulositropha]